MSVALVTGERGFVGKHLLPHLEDCGDSVYGFDLAFGSDVRDYETLRGMIERIEPNHIYHLAAQASPAESVTDPRRALEVNVGGALNLLEAVRHTGSRARVLLVGTSEEYGYENQTGPITEESPCFPVTPYGVSKLAAERLGMTYAIRYGINIVAMRPFNHAGPGQRSQYAVSAFAKQVVEVEKGSRSVIEHGDLRATRNYTDVRDVVRAYRLAIDLPSGVYNLCSDTSVTMRKVLELLVTFSDRTIATKLDESRSYSSDTPVWHTPICQKFHDATGWVPEISFGETLTDTLDWWRERL